MESTDGELVLIDELPCKPPLEVIQRDNTWALREYHNSGERPKDGIKLLETCNKRMDAMRLGKEAMQEFSHPCLLRWESENNVGGLYWNQDFEEVSIRFSSLINSWIIKSETDDLLLSVFGTLPDAVNTSKKILEKYDFKKLLCYSKAGKLKQEYEHRFIRNNIAEYGTRFNRGKIPKSAETATDSSEEKSDSVVTETSAEQTTSERSPPSTAGINGSLAAAVPDVTTLQTVDTNGVINIYETPWGDQDARVLALDPEYAEKRSVVNAFAASVANWISIDSSNDTVEIIDSATDPATWIAYTIDGESLSNSLNELSGAEQMRVLSQVGSLISDLQQNNANMVEAHPSRIYVDYSDSANSVPAPRSGVSIGMSGLGLRTNVTYAAGQVQPTRFTPPEVLDGRDVNANTPIYSLGAMSYYFVTGRPPYYSCNTTVDSLQNASVTPPIEVASVSLRTSQCIMQAMSEDPPQRQPTADRFVNEFVESVE